MSRDYLLEKTAYPGSPERRGSYHLPHTKVRRTDTIRANGKREHVVMTFLFIFLELFFSATTELELTGA